MHVDHNKFELDEAKSDYFKNCKYIARAPACIFLEGNRFSKEAKLLPIPLYAYAGVERGNYEAFRYEEHSDVALEEEKYLYTPPGMNEEERKMVRGKTPISSWYHNRIFYYHLILNERYKHTLVWWEAFKKAWKEKEDNDVDVKEVEKNYQKMLPKFKDYFKIKVWSDITSNIGLNESAAIAVAAGMAFYLEAKRSEESKVTTVGKLKNIISNLREQALTDEDFTGIFLYALALDFCTNGAAVFSSLMGIPNKQGVLDYEFLAHDELKKFYKPYSPSLIREMKEYGAACYSKKDDKISCEEKGRRVERYFKKLDDYDEYVKSKGVYAYWDRCLNLHSKVSKGVPLYKWSYSNFSQAQNKEPISLLIMKKGHFLDEKEEMKPLTDAKFKYYQISPVSFAIFSDPNTLALCEANPKSYVFENEKLKSWFFSIYNSRRKGWGAEGVVVMDEKEIKVKQEFARMWTNETRPEGKPIYKDEFDKVEEHKSSYQIFIIDHGEIERDSIGKIYFGEKIGTEENKGKEAKVKMKKKIKTDITATEYKILFHTLRNGGRAGDIFEILKQCFQEEKPPNPYKSWFDFYKKEPPIFWDSTRTYRKTIGTLSTFLQKKIGVELQSKKKKIYKLLPLPSYCVIKII